MRLSLFKSLIIFLILFISTIATADTKIVGHMDPLHSELLLDPIHLDCGVIVQEWRGSEPNQSKIEELCTFTKDRFYPFVESKGYRYNTEEFSYSMSFIPVDSNYRNLNDNTYRFQARAVYGEVSGYTSHTVQHIFVLSDMSDREFEVSVIHEIFHALSEHHGVFYQLPGKSTQEKAKSDELLAQEFTYKYIGKK